MRGDPLRSQTGLQRLDAAAPTPQPQLTPSRRFPSLAVGPDEKVSLRPPSGEGVPTTTTSGPPGALDRPAPRSGAPAASASTSSHPDRPPASMPANCPCLDPYPARGGLDRTRTRSAHQVPRPPRVTAPRPFRPGRRPRRARTRPRRQWHAEASPPRPAPGRREGGGGPAPTGPPMLSGRHTFQRQFSSIGGTKQGAETRIGPRRPLEARRRARPRFLPLVRFARPAHGDPASALRDSETAGFRNDSGGGETAP